MALDIAAGRRPRLSSLHRSDKLEDFGSAVQVVQFARAQAAKQVCVALRCGRGPCMCLHFCARHHRRAARRSRHSAVYAPFDCVFRKTQCCSAGRNVGLAARWRSGETASRGSQEGGAVREAP